MQNLYGKKVVFVQDVKFGNRDAITVVRAGTKATAVKLGNSFGVRLEDGTYRYCSPKHVKATV